LDLDVIQLPAGPSRVLLVDDEPGILAAAHHLLQPEGYELYEAVHPHQGLELLRQASMAVILSDQRLPELSGLEFLAQAKQLQPNASRVLMTAYSDADTLVAAINTGEIFRFLAKPWRREELLATVRNAAQRYELLCRNLALQANTAAANVKLGELNAELQKRVAEGLKQNEQLTRLNAALEHNLQSSVELCFKMLLTFDPSLGMHGKRVAELCHALAENLALPAEQCQVLKFSALLHDVGLVGMEHNLIKLWQQWPRSLSQTQRELIQCHPARGQELVGFMDHLAPVGKVIRAHHERYDGSGYPDGSKGAQIPWLGRLLAVAVAYIESNQPPEQALQILVQGSGTAYDPEAVRFLMHSLPGRAAPPSQEELLLDELRPGMVLASGVYAANGLLLMPQGQQLSETQISKLWNHHRVDPIKHTLLVYR
jgi:response regulator RpfG family c-di-GMP phosphodiesterase